jgi:regulator of sigma E protease
VIVLQSIAAFLLILGPLVLVHEFGHFVVAKALRIGVPVFSLGFGPRLFGIRRGGTDYRVSAIPLGGYVRLRGDEADESARGLPEEFLTRPKWQRFLVFVAGATFNVVLAFLITWFLFAQYGINEVADPNSYPMVRMVAPNSVAERAGLERGDTLIELGERDLLGFETFTEAYNLEIALSPNRKKRVLVDRGGQRVELVLHVEPDPVYGHGAEPGWDLSWGGDETPIIAGVTEGDRADVAGIRVGDRVVAAGGHEPITEFELRAAIEASPERDLDLRLERDGEEIALTVVPKLEDGRGLIGVLLGRPSVHRELSILEAARQSGRENLANSVMLFHVLKRMLTREVPLRSVSGPIGIAQVARDALSRSPRQFLWLLGFFSLQLGILNLLPVPVLDGGHIMILFVEGLIRRDLPDRVKERVMQVGFVFLLTFMGMVIYLDIGKLF